MTGGEFEPQQGIGVRLAEAAASAPVYPDGRFDGRGIVICAGGARLFTCAWIEIAFLRRHLGCTLPIEVWHIGPGELGPPMHGLLEALDAQPVDALDVARRHPIATLGGWQLKTYALMHCRFREVLLLDADNLPLRDPAFLFDEPAFRETGAMFWPDIVRMKAANPIWAMAGLSPDSGASFESGQVLLDKARCWRALVLADWINQNHVAFDDVIYGDKDAFYVAWRMSGQAYHLIEHAPKLLEHTLCQRAPDGRILFQHRSGHKWMLTGDNPRVEGFRGEDECRTLLAELQRLWDGLVFNPPQRSDAAQAVERELILARTFRYVCVGIDGRPIELLSHHRIGVGATRNERVWFVGDGTDGPELQIQGRGYASCVLRREADGVWRGTSSHHKGCAVELSPAVSDRSSRRSMTDRSRTVLSVVDRVLDAGSRLSPSADVIADYTTTLRVLASLDADVVLHLREYAEIDAPGKAASLARAALDDLAPMSLEDPMPGTGWQSTPESIAFRYESVRKR